MLKVHPRYVTAARTATTASDLHQLLQGAIQLEHTLLPPYLTAAYSLRSEANLTMRTGILEIAIEEMLHMAIAANVLNAIDGRPVMDGVDFVPSYPTPLPMSIGSGLRVGIRPFSLDLLQAVFMEIEEPEVPLDFPVARAPIGPAFVTIGTFYRAVMEALTNLGDGIFTGDPARQVVERAGFPDDALFPVTDVESAVRALDRVIKDGEGTAAAPFDDDGELAHYYRFAQFFHGRTLIEDSSVEQGYSFSGPAIAFDPAGVSNFPANPKAADHLPGSPERRAIDAFNQQYFDLLRLLQHTFDGHPLEIRGCRQAMRRVGSAALTLLETPLPDSDQHLAPTFEYMPPD